MKLALLMGGKPEGEKADPARDYAREAFSALKDDDEDGFVDALLGAVRACKAKESKPAPDKEDDDGEEY